jgi:aminoglycoside phosphotransferase (APT) family kinase protein
MAALSDSQLDWVLGRLEPGLDLVSAQGLRDGGSPWLLRLRRGHSVQTVVLRVGSAADRAQTRTEQLALELAHTHGIAVPRVIAADVEHDPPLLLIEEVVGTSTIPRERPRARLRELGSIAAALNQIPVPADLGLPRVTRSINGVDFAALRRESPARPLLQQAERLIETRRQPAAPEGFVHGDLWQGNTMWRGESLTAVIDWDCAGSGPAGVDLGSLRCDAATAFGPEAADDVLAGWEHAAGRPADDVAYWDVVAALSTPPDMGWFVQTIVSQGRPDLTKDVLVDRRDEYLRSALDELD